MAEQDDHIAELDEAEAVLRMVLPARAEEAKVLEPREEALDLSPVAATAQRATVLRIFG